MQIMGQVRVLGLVPQEGQFVTVEHMSNSTSAYFGGLVEFSLNDTAKALAKISLPYNQYEAKRKNQKSPVLFRNVVLIDCNAI